MLFILEQTKEEIRMPITKSISELRNKSKEISELVQQSNEPIFITNDGEEDMVIMSKAYYSTLKLKLDLYSKLSEAQSQIKAGEKGKPLKEVTKNIQNMIQ